MNKLIKPLAALTTMVMLSQLSACGSGGGGSSNNTNNGNTTTPPAPDPVVVTIPDTPATTTIDAPQSQIPREAQPAVDHAVLRHIHRNTLDSTSGPIDSPNGKVERLAIFGLYLEVDAQDDGSYIIEPEDNGLVYFRVTNTKPNGSVRVHNFYGAPQGRYLTFDTTNVPDDDPELVSSCRNVTLRLTNLPAEIANTARLQINGLELLDVGHNNTRAVVEDIGLCAINQNGDYLAMAVLENSDDAVRYGFNYYNGLEDGDLLEIDFAHIAETIDWSSDHPIDNEYRLSLGKADWPTTQVLYTSTNQAADNRIIPQFSALEPDYYRFASSVTDLALGIKFFSREFVPGLPQVDFTINDIELDEVSLNPLNVSWQYTGQDQPKMVSGIIFDTDFTQTYAFMSMDPQVLNDGKLDFPLDDVEGLLTSGLVAITGSAGTIDGSDWFIGEASLYSGFLYWPNEDVNDVANDNSDLFITAQITELLQIIIDQAVAELPALFPESAP